MDHQDLNELARLRVKPRTLKEYNHAVQQFLEWAPDDIKKGSAEEMDQMLNAFAHYIYRQQEGAGLGLVSKAKAGLEFYCGEYEGKLRRTELSLQGWRKVAQPTPHNVCPEQIAYLIGEEIMQMGEADAGIAVLLLFDSYIRAAELKGLKVGDVFVLPEDGTTRPHHAAIHVETGKRDSRQTIMIRPLFLARLLQKWKSRRKLIAGEGAPMLDMGLQKFRDLIHAATRRLGLAELEITPHTLRYGGATTDKLYNRLSDYEIQARGRWKEIKTCTHYVQVSGLIKQEEKITKEVNRRAKAMLGAPQRHFGVEEGIAEQ